MSNLQYSPLPIDYREEVRRMSIRYKSLVFEEINKITGSSLKPVDKVQILKDLIKEIKEEIENIKNVNNF